MAWVSDIRRLFAYAWQLPPSESESWRIQVAESWFDSALMSAPEASRCQFREVPAGAATTPERWPGTPEQLLATLTLRSGDREADHAKIVAALMREGGGVVTPPMLSA